MALSIPVVQRQVELAGARPAFAPLACGGVAGCTLATASPAAARLAPGVVLSPTAAAAPPGAPAFFCGGTAVTGAQPLVTAVAKSPATLTDGAPGLESVERAKEVLAGRAPPGEIRVACLGDSLTQWGYPDHLHRLLNDASSSGRGPARPFRVMDFGRGGAGLTRATSLPYGETPEFQNALACVPDIVVVQLGTNDGKQGCWQLAGGVQGYLEAYKALLERLLRGRSPAPRVILAAPPPVYKDGSMGVIASVINGVLPRVVQEFAASLGHGFADAFSELGGSALSRPSVVLDDGLHMGPEGNLSLASLFHGAILRSLGCESTEARGRGALATSTPARARAQTEPVPDLPMDMAFEARGSSLICAAAPSGPVHTAGGGSSVVTWAAQPAQAPLALPQPPSPTARAGAGAVGFRYPPAANGLRPATLPLDPAMPGFQVRQRSYTVDVASPGHGPFRNTASADPRHHRQVSPFLAPSYPPVAPAFAAAQRPLRSSHHPYAAARPPVLPPAMAPQRFVQAAPLPMGISVAQQA
eukprot:TRINITY_DN23744_c0_g5_i1.p1 TRINITY_DN23744_c0_g5~~TRINITY_DN23744_c0_g5_i1.p1  ORF type:complete len:529 (+),score=67.27 TRINITY_DN23744_c0_g5_i1:53-1639(+)